MKEFAVIGLGNFGATVAHELARLKCRVTAVDTDKTRVQNIQDEIHQAICGNAADRDFLNNLGPKNFDCFIVSTGEDSHTSILITLFLKELDAKSIIVKAHTADHAKILKKVGATMTVIPEQEMAIRLAYAQSESDLIDYLPLTGDYCVVEMGPPPNFIGKTLAELALRNKFHVQLVAVKEDATGDYNFMPGGSFTIQEKDVMVLLGRRQDIDSLKQ